ncbi:apolipoprotein N-acyltransferase [Mucilaginibacter sp. RS28]|uniref:Apolipoprotein N-acyltransferase n=2 Tax=Mucilaginibacter straminoryzae TaxID=2932774 RepID=A0A9X2BA60_9SPHI|nr:apolipoprotein N-acyltransferase [Mucilaginibacter straminoryzae]MCJ8210450.1 apolipoprotein N-acyltransferase [Mucilaginibacter straminoryzae]
MKKNLLLALFSGILLWLGWPPTSYITFLLFVGLVPMLLALENIIQSPVKRKGYHIFLTAFAGFFIWNTLSIYWVYNSLKTIGAIIAIPLSLIPYSLGPLLMALACWLYYRLRLATNRSTGLFGLVCFWMAYEYVHQTWPLAFPWMTLGNGFAVSHQWVQWYEYTGVYGGTVWIWLINILIFLYYQSLKEAQTKAYRVKVVTAFTIALVVPLAFSLIRYYSFREQQDPSDVVVAQPNIDPYEKEGSIPVQQQIAILTHLSDSVAQKNTEFFIWPETAIAEQFDENKTQSTAYYRQVRDFLGKYSNGNVITGAETYQVYNRPATESARAIPGTNQYWDAFNAALLIENSDRVQFYHKSKLVPGAEMIPFSSLSFLKPAFEHLGGATGSYGSQPEPSVFYTQSGIGSDPVICYESIWGEYVGKAVLKGAQFIAIITNDGWWENTSGKDQHLDYAKLRAIETRRWVCRSANTGISAFINERGDIVKHTDWWVRTAIKQDINLNSDLTFYTRYGDYIPKTASFLSVLGILFIGVKWRKAKEQAA